MEEPEWFGAGQTAFSILVVTVVFGLFLPLVFFVITDLIDIEFIANMPFIVRMFLIYLAPSMLVLKLVDLHFPIIWNIPAGCVQFIKSALPGDDSIYKLDGGFHIIIPIFIAWRHAWSWDEKWEINITKYRVNLKGTSDVLVDAKATCYPLKDSLLPLHLIGKDVKDPSVELCTEARKKFVVENMQAMLRKTAESCISKLREDCERNANSTDQDQKGRRRIDSAVDVIEQSDEAERRILEKLEKEEDHIANKFGIEIDYFTLDNIDFPPEIEIQRDSTTSYEILVDSAIGLVGKTNNDDVPGELTTADAIAAAQLQNGKITKNVNVKELGFQSDTLDAIKGILTPIIMVVAENMKNKKDDK